VRRPRKRQNPVSDACPLPCGLGFSLGYAGMVSRSPHACVLLSIQCREMFDNPRSSYQPPTSEWTPANQTCSIVCVTPL